MAGPERTLRKAVFLDRDGVINVDRDYLHRIEDFEFITGVPQALRRLQRAGWALVVVTNQSGIGRGRFGEADYQRLSAHMRSELQRSGVELDAVFHCPHRPDEGCDCRKPAPGMLLRAAAGLGLDLPASVMVGDKLADLQAGRAARVGRCVLVLSGKPVDEATRAAADEVQGTLADWVDSLTED